VSHGFVDERSREGMMRKQLGLAAAVVAAIVALSCPAAASVRYDFTGSYADPFFSFTGSYTYVAPTFITANTVVTPGSLSSCSVDVNGPATCHEVDFYPAALPTSGDQITFLGDRLGAIEGLAFLGFDATAFVTPGLHDDFNLAGALAAELTATVIPEPAAWTIVLLGLGGIGAIIRWRHEAIRRLL
jgi:hypothetical protein